MDENKKLWEQCVAFHGHVCGGLTIGYRAALYAAELLGLQYSGDEEVVCIAENDTCSIDAIQVVLGCTAGKGNLLFHLTGKQAFSFYDRSSGKSVRLIARQKPAGMSKAETLAYYAARTAEELFEVKPAVLKLPEEAKLFDSYVCEGCGEVTGANWIRVKNGKKLCLDCAHEYKRFNV